MQIARFAGIVASIALLVSLTAVRSATAAPGLLVGAVEDQVRAPTLAEAESKIAQLRLAGFRAVRIESIWTPGATQPAPQELSTLQSVATAGQMEGVRILVTVMQAGSRTTPLTDEAQSQFASYAAAIVRETSVRAIIVDNEPNLNRFWLPQFGLDGSDAAAASYYTLLARTYDALKAVNPDTSVYGLAVSPRGSDNPAGIRPTHSPTTFIRDVGAAYRTSGRTKPIMDALSIHVYEDTSSLPPTFAHPLSTSIAIADYDKLVGILRDAFDGTAQAGSTLPILYGEYGVETQIPSAKASLYTGTEPTTTKPATEATQASYYQQALALAFCQPNVEGIMILHTIDENALDRWQSGIFYADGSPKSSLPLVRAALNRTAGGSIAHCPGIQLPVSATHVSFAGRAAARRGEFRASFTCALDCVFQVRVVKVSTGVTKMVRGGRASIGQPVQVRFAPHHLGPGTYRYRLRLVHPVNPAPPTLRAGPIFRLP
ncbi:MAG: hypothetical protein E6G20_12555 [Actinobacteria bacterium]|nr:MAG: hypothetical protein E6G20_12555 [Actinomycetota bacterium]